VLQSIESNRREFRPKIASTLLCRTEMPSTPIGPTAPKTVENKPETSGWCLPLAGSTTDICEFIPSNSDRTGLFSSNSGSTAGARSTNNCTAGYDTRSGLEAPAR